MKVIKRNGDIVEFDKNKIVNAICRAMKYGSGIYRKDIAVRIADAIEDVNETLTVYQIEDMVYSMLIEHNQELTAKAYEGFRAVQAFKRETHPLDEDILGLVNHTNTDVLNENSNKQSLLASTQRDLIAGEVSKHLTLSRKIPTHIAMAHNEGIIKLHDLDYYLQDITNCELVPLDDMFEKGTVINKKLIETPKSLRTASTLATQIAAQISSFTYGLK